jgi:hypothetical protein
MPSGTMSTAGNTLRSTTVSTNFNSGSQQSSYGRSTGSGSGASRVGVGISSGKMQTSVNPIGTGTRVAAPAPASPAPKSGSQLSPTQRAISPVRTGLGLSSFPGGMSPTQRASVVPSARGTVKVGAGGFAEMRDGYGDFTGGGIRGYDPSRGPYISSQEVDRMARTLLGELDPKSYPDPKEGQHVMLGGGAPEVQSMLNRLSTAQTAPGGFGPLFGMDMNEITRPSQYSAWGDPNLVNKMTKPDYNDPELAAARRTVANVQAGIVPNQIGSRTHYANLDVASPNWKSGLDVKVGAHTFGNDPTMSYPDRAYDPNNEFNMARAPGGFAPVTNVVTRPPSSTVTKKQDRYVTDVSPAGAFDMPKVDERFPGMGAVDLSDVDIDRNAFDVERATDREVSGSYPSRGNSFYGSEYADPADVANLAAELWGEDRSRSPNTSGAPRAYPSRGNSFYGSEYASEADIANLAGELYGRDRSRSPAPPFSTKVASRQEFPGSYPAAPVTGNFPARPEYHSDNTFPGGFAGNMVTGYEAPQSSFRGNAVTGYGDLASGVGLPEAFEGNMVTGYDAASSAQEDDGVWDPTSHVDMSSYMAPFVQTGALKEAMSNMPFKVPFKDMLSGIPKETPWPQVYQDMMNTAIVQHLESRPPKPTIAEPATSSPTPSVTVPQSPKVANKDQDRIMPEAEAPAPSLIDNPPIPGGEPLHTEEDSQEPTRVADLPQSIVPPGYTKTPRRGTGNERRGDGKVALPRVTNRNARTNRGPIAPEVPPVYEYGPPAGPSVEDVYWQLMGPQILANLMRGAPIYG